MQTAEVEVVSRVLLAHCHKCGWESEAYDEADDIHAEGRAGADAEAHVCEDQDDEDEETGRG